MSDILLVAHMAALERVAERLGWRLISVEVDEPRQVARVQAMRHDGVRLTLDVRGGRAIVERERQEVRESRRGRRGDVYRAAELHSVFLGRQRFDSAAEAVRAFALYLMNNGSSAALGPGASTGELES